MEVFSTELTLLLSFYALISISSNLPIFSACGKLNRPGHRSVILHCTVSYDRCY